MFIHKIRVNGFNSYWFVNYYAVQILKVFTQLGRQSVKTAQDSKLHLFCADLQLQRSEQSFYFLANINLLKRIFQVRWAGDGQQYPKPEFPWCGID